MGFQRVLAIAGRFLKKNAPTIATGAGVAGMIVTTVWSCKQTLKIEKITIEFDDKEKELDEKIEQVLEKEKNGELPAETYTQQDISNDKRILKGKKYWEIAKLYIAPGALGAVSLALICWGHSSLLKDKAALTGAFTGLTEAFKAYRKRVVEDIGPEKDREYFTGMKTEERVLTNPETGETVVEKVQVPVGDSLSIYAQEFNEFNVNFNHKSHMQNLYFLKRAECMFNDKLKARGFITLNEVLDYLRLPWSYAGQHVGWVYGQNGDNFISFGIEHLLEEMKDTNAWYYNDTPRTIRMDFNVDGDIDYIFTKAFGKSFAEKIMHS